MQDESGGTDQEALATATRTLEVALSRAEGIVEGIVIARQAQRQQLTLHWPEALAALLAVFLVGDYAGRYMERQGTHGPVTIKCSAGWQIDLDSYSLMDDTSSQAKFRCIPSLHEDHGHESKNRAKAIDPTLSSGRTAVIAPGCAAGHNNSCGADQGGTLESTYQGNTGSMSRGPI